MVDLVERLRGYRPANEWGDGVEHTICNEAADEIDRLRKAMGAEGQQFMQALVDEASAEIQKRKAAEAELTRLRATASDVVASASDTYKKQNGHLASFEDDSGEKCWIVPFDAFESLRSAVETMKTTGGDHG